MDDVCLGESGAGCVLRTHLIDGALKAETEIVLLDFGGEGEVDDRLCDRGVYELNGSTGEDVAIALKDDVSTGEIDAAKDDGFRGGATNLEVRAASDAESTADEI